MRLLWPKKQTRNQRKFYEVTFTAADTEGTVTFEFTRGNRKQTRTVTISDDSASYKWKPPRKWRKGRTTVTATFTPKPTDTELNAAAVTGKVRIR